MYTVLSRPPTKDEGETIVAQTKQGVGNFGCLGLIMAMGALSFGGICGCVGGWFSEEAGTIGQWTGWGFAVVLGACIVIGFIPFFRRQQKKAVLDKEQTMAGRGNQRNRRVRH